MTEHSSNDQFHASSFMQGCNLGCLGHLGIPRQLGVAKTRGLSPTLRG